MSGDKDFSLVLNEGMNALYVYCRASKYVPLLENLVLNLRLQEGLSVENHGYTSGIKVMSECQSLEDIKASIEAQLKGMEISF
jgi:hypothetical protein